MFLIGAAPRARASSTDLWLLGWWVGGTSQRCAALLAAVSPPVSGAMLVAAIVSLYFRGGMDDGYRVFYLGFIAIAAWPAFQKAIAAPMYGPAFWRAKIANGWVPEATRDFYEELARYKEERGIDGQLQGDLVWSWAYALTYFATMIIAILATWVLTSWASLALVATFSLVEFPTALGCWFVYDRRNQRQFREAVSQGYSFSAHRLGALQRLQP